MNMNVLDAFQPITTFIFDVDGVLTDGTVLLLDGGVQARRMHTKDGLALQMALRAGYRVIIVSGAYSEPVLKRLQYLGLTEVFLAIKDKKSFLNNYLTEQKVSWKEALFMGDDLPDLDVLRQCGLSCCPADAVVEVKKESTYISALAGGAGCVRDVIEKVLKLNDHWNFTTEVTSQ